MCFNLVYNPPVRNTAQKYNTAGQDRVRAFGRPGGGGGGQFAHGPFAADHAELFFSGVGRLLQPVGNGLFCPRSPVYRGHTGHDLTRAVHRRSLLPSGYAAHQPGTVVRGQPLRRPLSHACGSAADGTGF